MINVYHHSICNTQAVSIMHGAKTVHKENAFYFLYSYIG